MRKIYSPLMSGKETDAGECPKCGGTEISDGVILQIKNYQNITNFTYATFKHRGGIF